MESELLKYAAQLPIVAIVVGLVIWFVKIMAAERDKAATREQKRDETFSETMKQSSETFATALDRNTQVLGELDRTITSWSARGAGDNHRPESRR